eukprot:15475949-Alexandrium_andersonii.AAC.1
MCEHKHRHGVGGRRTCARARAGVSACASSGARGSNCARASPCARSCARETMHPQTPALSQSREKALADPRVPCYA